MKKVLNISTYKTNGGPEMDKTRELFEKFTSLKPGSKAHKETAAILNNELVVWDLIREFPGELGFVLQEKDYSAYVDTFGASDEVVLSEEQFNLLKQYFTNLAN